MKPWKKLAIILVALAVLAIIPITRKFVFLILPIGRGTLDTIATILFVIFLLIVFFGVVAKYVLRFVLWLLTAAEKIGDSDFDAVEKIKEMQKKYE